MITILRKHHRWLMIVIAILAIPFVFYFNKSDLGVGRQPTLGRIYDRTITLTEFSRNARLLNLARGLGLSLPGDLMISNVQNENDMFAEFTWNRLTLRHEAERLGVRPTSGEITDYVKNLDRFKGDSGFDMGKYTEFTNTTLPALGLDEAQIEEVVSDQLTLDRVKNLVGAFVHISDAETAENYEKSYGKMNVAVVRFNNKDFEKDVKISDEDVSKYYDGHKAELKSEEKRKIEFVTFAMTEAEKKLTGKERVEPLQRVADRANEFTQEALAKDANFAEVAAKYQVPVVSTEEFTMTAPDPKLKSNPQLMQAAFQMTQQQAISDPVQTSDGFTVIHLLGATESHPLTLEEATTKIIDTLTAERLREIVSQRGAEMARQMREALNANMPLDDWAKSNGLKLEHIPAFSLVDPSPTPKPDNEKKDAIAEAPKVAEVTKDAAANVTPAPDAPPNEVPIKQSKLKKGKSKNAKPKEEKPKDERPIGEKDEVKVAAAETPETKKDEIPDLIAIKNAVAVLNPGDVSDPMPAEKGALIAVLEKRAPADKTDYASIKENYETQITTQSQLRAFIEWLRDRRKAAGVVPGAG